MKSAYIINQAGSRAGGIARRALRAALACALVFGGTGMALAQQYGERRDDAAMQARGERGERGARFQLPQDRDQRQAEARAYEEQRRAQQQFQQEQRQQEQRRNSGRMTADERREMRRQINEAGMDLYPPRR